MTIIVDNASVVALGAADRERGARLAARGPPAAHEDGSFHAEMRAWVN